MLQLLFFLSIAVYGCGFQSPPSDFPYRMDLASETFHLPDNLKEISGLSLGFDDSTLFAVEDETGQLFLIDKTSGKTKLEVPFWKDGDYESVERVGDEVFVGKSNGNLYQIQNPGSEAQTVTKHESPLDKSCDMEGMAYDAKNQRLLLSCKGDAGIERARAIYAFDLKTMALDSTPAYVITWDSVFHFIQANPDLERWQKLLEMFDPKEPDLAFAPSALAIHPITGHLYLLSSVGKHMVVLDPTTGDILHIQKLKKKVHPQPEGICFDPDGTMYVSNEAKDGTALIHRFVYRVESEAQAVGKKE